MKTAVLEQVAVTPETIQLVDGTFTPSEASDIIGALIDEKINFHKIQRLQLWEGNHAKPTHQLDSRIEALEKEKAVAKAFIGQYRGSDQKISINGILELKVVE